MSDFRIDRRALCATSGLVVCLSAAGVRVAQASAFPDDGDAFSLWQLWNDRTIRGTPLALVAAGVLAASPHDTQPWLFHVRSDAIDVYADLSRNLGAMDALVREMHLGLGCAIENMLVAAPVNGFDATLEIVPGSLLDLRARQGVLKAATLRLSPVAPRAPDSLHRAIPERHTNRYAYERARTLAAPWQDFAAHAGVDDGVRLFLFADGPQRARFDALVVDATQAIVDDPQMGIDNTRWLRASRADIAAHRDGVTLDAAGLSPLMLFLAKLFPVSSDMSNRAWLSQTRDTHLATAPLTGLIAVGDRYDRRDTIAAGRTWQRLHLSATVAGIAMQPLNQPIEMIDRERQLGRGSVWAARAAQLTGPQWQATFAFRAGYSNDQGVASPRRALHDVVRA